MYFPQDLMFSTNPLIRSDLTILRNRETQPPEFRNVTHRLVSHLLADALQGIGLDRISVQTPLCEGTGHCINERIAHASVLRAGLGMAYPAMEILPAAPVLHLGIKRDESKPEKPPILYYDGLEGKPCHVDTCLLLDPMLATGNTACLASERLLIWGVKRLFYIGIVGAPEGYETLHRHFPLVQVWLAAMDEGLDANKYIRPGLGDFGDRYNGTTPQSLAFAA